MSIKLTEQKKIGQILIVEVRPSVLGKNNGESCIGF